METNPQPANDGISGDVMLYSTPEPLNVELHGGLGIQLQPNPFGFAEKAHFVPLAVTEFAPAGMSFPIIFVGDQKVPVAVMSLQPDDNLFITDGVFDAQSYVPAYLRRYPFVLAANEAEQQMIVCIDRAAKALVPGGDVALFDGDQPTEFTKSAVEFCKEFETEVQRTNSFIALMKTLDLFEMKTATYTPPPADGDPGKTTTIAEYWAISEDKLSKLSDGSVMELQKSGALHQIYAHINSLLNWDRLILRAITRDPANMAVQGNA